MEKKKYNLYHRWIYLECILLILDVVIPFRLDINRLCATEIINVAFDWMGMFVLIIVLSSCIRGRKTKSSSSFISLTICGFFIMFFEVGTWSVDKIAGLRIINYFCNIGSNSALLISIFIYICFMCDSLGIDRKKISYLYNSVYVVISIGIVLEILNYWFGYFYRIDANGTYIRNSLGSILGFIPFIYSLGISCILVMKQNNVTVKKIDYLCYAIVPMIISLWYFITNMPPTLFASSFITILIIYGNIYVRQGLEMEYSILENAKKDAELAWQRNQLMRSQIKPHFIFNCLGSIEQLCRIDVDKARNALHRFAKYLRVNMDSMSEQALVPFSSELEHIHNYVWLEHMRFEDDLEYIEMVETEKFYIPSLSIQPIVENAIKHGMMGKEDGTLKVSMTVHETEEYFEVIIEDDGNGFDENKKNSDGRSHIGIRNVRESLENTVSGKLTILSRIGEGTQVIIQIPKDINEMLIKQSKEKNRKVDDLK